MADTPEKPSLSPAEPAKPAPAEQPPARILPPRPATGAVAPARPPAGAGEVRREFFSDAMRETLAPFAGILERKINPLLAALESIPGQVERISKVNLPRMLDQPQAGGHVPLPVADAEPLRFLRPPGAMEPGQFENVCSRCGKCVEACPANAIHMDAGGLTADGLPYVVAAEQPCVVCDSLACMNACPTGALKVLDRLQIKMGTARVNLDLCRREFGEDCRLCVEACPITGQGASPAGDAIVIHAESGRVRVRKNICVGCGLCENHCPTQPRAIQVIPYRGVVDPIIA